jgi:hypothetical protein
MFCLKYYSQAKHCEFRSIVGAISILVPLLFVQGHIGSFYTPEMFFLVLGLILFISLYPSAADDVTHCNLHMWDDKIGVEGSQPMHLASVELRCALNPHSEH